MSPNGHLFEEEKASYGKAELITSDTYSALREIEDEKFELIITSPPYNIGKAYETRTSIEEYLATQKKAAHELVRVLKPTGSLCWQVGNYVEKGEVFPLDVFYYDMFKDLGLALRNRIIWHFGHGLHASRRFSGRYETILWFTKSKDYVFNLDAVRVPSKYPGKKHFKGPNRGKLSGNPKGKNPSDVWEILDRDWNEGIWNIPNVKSNHPEKTEHPCQFPVELVERCVLALTNEGGWILDPYGGVGSVAIGAVKNNRNAVSVDKDLDYTKVAEARLRKLYSGELKTRPMTKPIHKPTGNEKTAAYPEEWLYQK